MSPIKISEVALMIRFTVHSFTVNNRWTRFNVSGYFGVEKRGV